MNLTRNVLELDYSLVSNRIQRFIRNYVEVSNTEGVVLGVSGGIDSCTTAAIAALAIGGSKVLGLVLPEDETFNSEDIKHAELVAEKFGFKIEVLNITKTVETICRQVPIFDPKDKICKGNLKARTRMTYIYYFANKLDKIVCGSSDKSEVMMGYYTKWGDGAADIAPLMDLYKTQVRQIASYINIPEDIVRKPSTPALWRGQLAEEELGMKYETLDLILYGLEHFKSSLEIAKQLKIPLKTVSNIKKRWLNTEHKRRLPLTAKIQYRTIGADFRVPYVIS